MFWSTLYKIQYFKDLRLKINNKLDHYDRIILQYERPLIILQDYFIIFLKKKYHSIVSNPIKFRRYINIRMFVKTMFIMYMGLEIFIYHYYYNKFFEQPYMRDVSHPEIEPTFDNFNDKVYKEYIIRKFEDITKENESLSLIDLMYIAYYNMQSRPELSYTILHLCHLKYPDIIEGNSKINLDIDKNIKTLDEFIANKII